MSAILKSPPLPERAAETLAATALLGILGAVCNAWALLVEIIR